MPPVTVGGQGERRAQGREGEEGAGKGGESREGSPVPVPARGAAVHDGIATISYLRDALFVLLPVSELTNDGKIPW